MSVAVVGIAALVVLAAVIDLRDAARGRRRRRSDLIARERRDLHADLEATQHHGIHTPLADVLRDRQRGR